jgi:hypothetical protein
MFRKRVLFPCLLYLSVAMYINILIYLLMRILNLMFLKKTFMQICIILGVLLMLVGSIGGFWQIFVEAYAYKFYPN